MLDAQIDDTLPIALSREIDRAREWLSTLPPTQRQACELMVAARVMTWAHDLERISWQLGGAT